MSRYQMHTEMNDETGSQTVTVTPREARRIVPNFPERARRPNVILLLGGTGTGKSTFIATISGAAVGIGHDLRSFTSSCQAVEFPLDATHVVQLVDTPGFNDTTRSNLDVLSAIAGWIQTNKPAIAGLVYLHRINEKRFTGADRMTLKILQAMCGQHFLPHVVLCTTMWDKIPDKNVFSEAEVRESELLGAEDLWSPLLARGARHMRYTGDRASGINIIEAIFEYPARSKMEMQLELRNGECDVEDTLAGQIITAEIRKKEERLRKQRMEEDEEERELKEQLRLEHEALQQDKQKKRDEEASMFRRTDRRSPGASRVGRRPRSRDVREVVPSVRSSREGRGRMPESGDTASSANQFKGVFGFRRR